MKSKFLFLLFVFFLGLSSCKKENEPTLVVRFGNISENPYTLNFNSEKFIMKSYQIMTFDLIQGKEYSWSVKQNSGYLLYPTERSGRFVATKDIQIYFP
ncbi:hypothetical protein DKB58_01755 [Capnocytophaga canimorsus]|uniref:hypothetical protein n=1 Tax=Capnocytophaga canimorsus TaxID=28188 RepID=UPI000D6E698C|nr:hypothetical protein [Capnocytophaga canimorsus]AWL77773.1 hypothetical protein DKB58_01755 [Capnocytophaga canimorsus]